MPVLHIRTNALTQAPDASLLAKLSAEIATMLGKPESYVMLSIEPCPAMLFAGSDAPCAFVELKSIGLAESRLPALSNTLCEILHQQLGIPMERTYIDFTDLQRKWFGWNKSTF